MKTFRNPMGRNCPKMNTKGLNAFAFLFILAFFSVLVSCEKIKEELIPETDNYYLIQVNDKSTIISSSDDGPAISTVRFVINATLKSKDFAGSWDFDTQMYNYMDFEDNATDGRVIGYMSGSLKWNSYKIPVDKLGIGVVPGNGCDFTTYYSSSPHDFQIPYFNNIIAGPYNYVAIAEDGTQYPFSGSQQFILGWPTMSEVSIGGTDVNPEQSNKVMIYFRMVDVEGITATDVKLKGELKVFNSEESRQEWILAHPFPDYLANPKLIIAD